jgi:hypothetical protein
LPPSPQLRARSVIKGHAGLDHSAVPQESDTLISLQPNIQFKSEFRINMDLN